MAYEKHIHLQTLIDRVYDMEKEYYGKTMVKKIIRDFIKVFTAALMDEYPIQIKGVGTFRHYKHKARLMHTWGNPIYCPDRMRIKFRTANELANNLTVKYIKEAPEVVESGEQENVSELKRCKN